MGFSWAAIISDFISSVIYNPGCPFLQTILFEQTIFSFVI